MPRPVVAVAAILFIFSAPPFTVGTTPGLSEETDPTDPWHLSPQPPHHLAEVIGDDQLYPVTLERHEHTTETQTTTDNKHSAAYREHSTAEEHSASAGSRERHSKPAVTVMEQARTRRDAMFNATVKEGHVLTGATILNIRGPVRDSIADGSASPSAPSPRASRLDAFVIRPHAPALPPTPRTAATPAPPAARAVLRVLVAAAHASVTLPCDLHNVTDYRWFRDGEEVAVGSGAASWADEAGALRVVAAREEEGAWWCEGAARGGNVLRGNTTTLALFEEARGVYLAVDGRRLDAGGGWVPLREKATLDIVCVAEGGVPAPTLSWRLVSADVTMDSRPHLQQDGTDHSAAGVAVSRAVLTASRDLHNAWLECRAIQSAPEGEHAAGAYNSTPAVAKIQMHVTYPPSFVISRWPGFGVALMAGAGAALRCDVDANPPARAARWYRDPPPDPATAAPPSPAPHATLVWAALGAQHAGWYRCRASWGDRDYSSIGYFLNVREPEEGTEDQPGAEETSSLHEDAASPSSTREDEGGSGDEQTERDHVEVPLGGAAQLHCPKGSVGCWWRRDGEEWVPAGSHHAHGVLGIKNAIYEEGGEYRCVGARDRGPMRDLKRVTLDITGAPTATALAVEASDGGWRLTCAACGRGLAARWVSGDRVRTAPLRPARAPNCYTTTTTVPALPHEVLCVVTSPRSRSGAVAVFPPRAAPAPRALLTSSVNAPHASIRTPISVLIVLYVLLN